MKNRENPITLVWQGLTTPSKALTTPIERRRAQLLLSIILTFCSLNLPIFIISQIYLYQQGKYFWVNPSSFLWFITTIFSFFIYIMSRGKYYQIAALLFTSWLMISTSISIFTEGDSDAVIGYLITVIIASILFDLRGTSIFAGMGILLTILEIIYSPPSNLANPIVTIIASVLIVIFVNFRNQVEKDRQTELSKINEMLRKNEARYRSVVEDQTELICRYTTDIVLTFANDAYCREYGDSYDDLVGKKILDRILPEDREAVKNYVASLTLENPTATTEHRSIMLDGTARWHQWKDRAVFDSNGNIIEYQGVGRDITQRKLAEEALRESQQLLDNFVNNTPAYIYIKDIEGHHVFINRTYESDYKFKNNEIQGKTDYELFPKHIADGFRATDLKVIQTETIVSEEETSSLDGEEHTHLSTKFPLYDSEGKIYAIGGVSQDITERKLAEQEREKLLEQMRVTLSRTEALYSSGRSLTGMKKNLAEALEIISGDIAKALPARQAVINLPDIKARKIIHRVAVGQGTGKHDTIDFEEFWDGLGGWALREMVSVLSHGDAPDPREGVSVQARRTKHNEGSTMVVPLIYDGKSFGTITAINNIEDKQFTEDDLELFTAIAEQTAIAIENLRLFEVARATEEHLRTLFASMHDMVFVIDTEGIFVDYYQPKSATLYLPPKVSPGQHFDKVLPPDVAAKFNAALESINSSGKAQSIEYSLDTENGKQWFSANISDVNTKEGKIGGYISVVRDVSERKVAEEALKAREVILGTVAFAAEHFLRVNTLEDNLHIVLERLGQAAKVDRVHVFKNQLDENNLPVLSRQLDGWTAEKITTKFNIPQTQNFERNQEDWEEWDMKLSNNSPIIGHTKDFPPPIQQHLAAQDIQSIVIMPIFIGQLWWGHIGFDMCQIERKWSQVEIDALKAAASTIGAAVEREQAEEALQKAYDKLEERVEERTRQLQQMNQRVEAILNSNSDAIVLADMDGKIKQTNSSFDELFGYQTDEAFQQSLTSLIVPSRVETFLEVLQTAIEDEQSQRLEVRVQRKDGSYFDAEVAISSIVGFQITGIVCSFRDITERKQAEKEIHKLNTDLEYRLVEINTEKQRSESILQNIADAVVFTNIDTNILYVNAAWEKLTGYSLYEAMGQNPRILQSSKTSSETYQDMWKTILSGEVWQGVLFNKRKDGTEYDAEITIAPIKDKHGEISHFVGVQRDVTEERQLKAIRERFVANAAHDLGNPVAILKTALHILKKDTSKLDTQVKIIEYATERLAELVKDLLTLSRLDRNIMVLDLVPVDFNIFIEHIVETQGILAQEKKQNIFFNRTADIPQIWLDRHQIERVIVNLLGNAQNYSPEGGEIHLSIAHENDAIIFAIKDEGMGIAPKNLQRIFERFFRSDEAQDTTSGTGLGLPIVREIVELHKGKIEVESTLGKGTTFRVYLPVEAHQE